MLKILLAITMIMASLLTLPAFATNVTLEWDANYLREPVDGAPAVAIAAEDIANYVIQKNGEDVATVDANTLQYVLEDAQWGDSGSWSAIAVDKDGLRSLPNVPFEFNLVPPQAPTPMRGTIAH